MSAGNAGTEAPAQGRGARPRRLQESTTAWRRSSRIRPRRRTATAVWRGSNRAGVFGLDTARIAAAGASAGGGLAAGLALLARDRQHVSPCFQLLTFPMLDDRDADVSRRWHRDEMAALGRALNGS